MGDSDSTAKSALRWLHLSDLQIGLRGSLLTQADFRRAFERDLADMHDETGPWDVVALTGDVALTARPREYEVATEVLQELWAYLASLGSRPTLLVVPGNHDETWLTSDPRSGPPLDLELHGSFAAFIAWREAWERASNDTLSRAPGSHPGDFVARMNRGALRLGILGLNSACRLEHHGTSYLVSPLQVADAAGGDLKRWSRQVDAVLMLSHHGPSRWVRGTAALPEWSDVPLISLSGGTASGPHLQMPGNAETTLIRGLPLKTDGGDGPCGYMACGVHLVDGGVEVRVRARRWSTQTRDFREMFHEPPGRRASPVSVAPGGTGVLPHRQADDTRWFVVPPTATASRDGRRRAAVDADLRLTVREDDRVLWSMRLPEHPELVSMSPGGVWLLVRRGSSVMMLDASTGVSVDVRDTATSFRVVEWLGDDTFVYDDGGNAVVRMVEADRAWLVRTHFHPQRGGVRALAATSDRQHLAIGTGDGVAVVRIDQPPGDIVGGFGRITVNTMTWSVDGDLLAVGHDAGLILLDATCQRRAAFVGPTDPVIWVSFSPDQTLVACVTARGELFCVRLSDWATVNLPAGIRGGDHIWSAAAEALPRSTTSQVVTAKVVLLGEANAGKSSLALQLAERRFAELGPTQGMQFWPVTAAALDPSIEHPPGERREVVLWDMGGQDEYRLLHRAFLRDTTVALFVFEPRRGATAFHELDTWLPQLRDRTGVVRLLVGAKLDDPSVPRDDLRAAALCGDGTFQAYLETSARTPLGIPELGAAIAGAIDWSKLGITVRSALFQRIRDYITVRRESGRVVMPYLELEETVRSREGRSFDRRAVNAVVETMDRQGFIADLRLADGTRMLVLDVSHVERYGGSLILAARDNPRGVPALDRSTITAPGMELPRIPREQRLPYDQELVVLDAVIQTLIEHGICFPSSGTLVFPSMFRGLDGATPPPPVGISTRFDFFGASDMAYAALVSALAMNSRIFGPPRLWPDQAEFASGVGVCGLRLSGTADQRRRGQGRLEVFFSLEASDDTRRMFVGVVESLLRDLGLTVEERPAVVCACGRVFDAQVVRGRLDGGRTDIGCEDCDRRTPLLPAHDAAEGSALAQGIRVFRTELEQRRSELVSETKADLSNARKDHDMPGPVRILHLSDLHISAEADVVALLQPLLTDLRDEADGLGERLDYVVVSGDITNRASAAEFIKAREFVQHLLAETEVSAERCIVVPGNHDQSWNVPLLYQWDDGLDPSRIDPSIHVAQGAGWLVRNDAVYASRFAAFSEHFYHPLFLREYPADPAQQGGAVLFDEHRLQFLTFNSSWQIDKWFRDRSHLHPGAVSRALLEADGAVRRAREAGRLANDARVLRLAVWHHPLTGNEKIQDDAFADNLRKAGVNACLHGHVHEDRADLVGYLHPTRKLHVIGAGSFAAPDEHRPASTPQLYNVLEIHPGALRVHTRAKKRGPGAWEPWAQWPVPDGRPGERRSWYEFRI